MTAATAEDKDRTPRPAPRCDPIAMPRDSPGDRGRRGQRGPGRPPPVRGDRRPRHRRAARRQRESRHRGGVVTGRAPPDRRTVHDRHPGRLRKPVGGNHPPGREPPSRRPAPLRLGLQRLLSVQPGGDRGERRPLRSRGNRAAPRRRPADLRCRPGHRGHRPRHADPRGRPGGPGIRSRGGAGRRLRGDRPGLPRAAAAPNVRDPVHGVGGAGTGRTRPGRPGRQPRRLAVGLPRSPAPGRGLLWRHHSVRGVGPATPPTRSHADRLAGRPPGRDPGPGWYWPA